MAHFIDTTIFEDESRALTKYLTSRNLTVGEVAIVLEATLDKGRFIVAMEGVRELKNRGL